uniref:CHK kinase-like domain-containing protein n=1 Tax=Riptortus pedestris TaxID=329032 RepID=R4WDB1_RIPPE|nr:conserved hypothetical protein [Riptortus pedestris]
MLHQEDEEWVKETLVESERKKCISRVLQLDADYAVAKGNNYVSDIYRLSLKLVNHSGEIENRSLMYKIIPNVEDDTKLPEIRELHVFDNEIKMYSEVLPAMERLLLEKDPTAEPLWPRLVGFKRNYEGLLIEDISTQGYKMEDRTKGLDFEYICIALQALARFHALAAVLIERGELSTADFDEYPFMKDMNKCREMAEKMSRDYRKTLESWKGEWSELSSGVVEFCDALPDRLWEVTRRDESKFFTLNHGDYWVNNILFKKDPSGKPTTIKMIDFQLCFCNNPCLDVNYLISSSLRPEYFDRKGELLKVYYNSLSKDLKLFDYKEIPTFDFIQESYKKTSVFGANIALAIRPYMTCAVAPFELKKEHPEFDVSELLYLVLQHGGDYVQRSTKAAIKQFKEQGLIK